MNEELALQEVQEFRAHLEHRHHLRKRANPDWGGIETTTALLNQRVPLIDEIAIEWGLHRPERIRGWATNTTMTIAACDELIGTLQDRERRDRIFEDRGPRLSAAKMHAWVWSSAAGLWASGYRRAAVQQAAAALFDGYLPGKLGVRKTSPATQPSSAFSIKESTPESPRLRLPHLDTRPEDWKSAHQGAMYLGMACQMLARNLTTHDASELDEQLALEHLAMLSQFARLVDVAEADVAGRATEAPTEVR